jgi:hypothetical protein
MPVLTVRQDARFSGDPAPPGKIMPDALGGTRAAQLRMRLIITLRACSKMGDFSGAGVALEAPLG